MERHGSRLICLHMDILLFPSFMEKIVLSSLNSLCTFVENWLPMYMWVYLYTLRSVSLIYLSVLTPIPYHVDYLMSGNVSLPTLIFIFRSVFVMPGPLHVYVNFRISLSISMKTLAFWELHQTDRATWRELIS